MPATKAKPKPAKSTPNPLRMDPTRTGLLRRQFEADIKRRITELNRDIRQLIVTEDAFGLTEKGRSLLSFVQSGNGRWQMLDKAAKVAAFETWLRDKVETVILSGSGVWKKFLETSIFKGIARARADAGAKSRAVASAVDDPFTADLIAARKKRPTTNAGRLTTNEGEAFYAGGEAAFLSSSFGSTASAEILSLINASTLSQITGMTEAMIATLVQTMTAGVIAGSSPYVVAQQISTALGISLSRATRIVRTEMIRIFAEGQLNELESLGVTELGVMVEWGATRLPNGAFESKVCTICRAFAGTIYKIEEASGLIPAHPGCRCCWLPSVPKVPTVPAPVTRPTVIARPTPVAVKPVKLKPVRQARTARTARPAEPKPAEPTYNPGSVSQIVALYSKAGSLPLPTSGTGMGRTLTEAAYSNSAAFRAEVASKLAGTFSLADLKEAARQMGITQTFGSASAYLEIIASFIDDRIGRRLRAFL